MGRVSRNVITVLGDTEKESVAPRMGRVSRNVFLLLLFTVMMVAPRMGRVSRNANSAHQREVADLSRPAWGV